MQVVNMEIYYKRNHSGSNQIPNLTAFITVLQAYVQDIKSIRQQNTEYNLLHNYTILDIP